MRLRSASSWPPVPRNVGRKSLNGGPLRLRSQDGGAARRHPPAIPSWAAPLMRPVVGDPDPDSAPEAMIVVGKIEALPTGFTWMIPTREVVRLPCLASYATRSKVP